MPPLGRLAAVFCCLLFLEALPGICLAAQTDPQAEPARTESASAAAPIRLNDATLVRVRILSNVSSANATQGDEIRFSVANDVVAENMIVVRRGAPAVGHIAFVKKKGRMGHAGKLAIAIDSVETVTGEKVALRGQETRRGKDAGPAMYPPAMAAVDYTIGSFGLGAPIMLFVKGEDVSVPAFTTFSSYVDGDTVLDQSQVRSAQPAPRVPTGLATIYVLRSEKRGDKIPSIYCGALEIGQLRYQHYLEVQIPPGEYLFQSPAFKDAIQVRVQSEQTYYIHFFPNSLFWVGHLKLMDALAGDDLLALSVWRADPRVDLSNVDQAKLIDKTQLWRPPEDHPQQ